MQLNVLFTESHRDMICLKRFVENSCHYKALMFFHQLYLLVLFLQCTCCYPLIPESFLSSEGDVPLQIFSRLQLRSGLCLLCIFFRAGFVMLQYSVVYLTVASPLYSWLSIVSLSQPPLMKTCCPLWSWQATFWGKGLFLTLLRTAAVY